MSITLRPYQQEAVNAVYKHLSERDDNPCIVLPTGVGKSICLAQIATDAVKNWGGRVLLLAHVKELLEQNAEKIRLLCPDVRVGLYSAGLGSKDTDDSIIVAGIQSVYKKACELGRFDLILIDECFPAGTMIDTPRGDIPIEDLYVGEPVRHALGVGEIEAISAHNTNELIELEFEDGKIIQCTPNHPFFTEQGWQKAEALEVGSCLFSRKDMQILRESYASSNSQRYEWKTQALYGRKEMECTEVLFKNLQTQSKYCQGTLPVIVEIGSSSHCKQEMRVLREDFLSMVQARCNRQNCELSNRERLAKKTFLFNILLQESRECYVDTGCKGESQSNSSTKRDTTQNQRRQWMFDKTANSATADIGTELASRIFNCNRTSTSKGDAQKLQIRYSKPRNENSDRNRWCFTQDDKKAKKRQTANGIFATQRLARITNIKCKSPVPVYNLQIKGHPSYYANGILAHNCHLLAPDGEGMYRRFLKDAKVINPNIRIIGLTATPFRLKGGLICKPENILNHVCYEAGIKEMIVNGYLSPLKSKAGKSKVDLTGLQTRAGEFIASQMQEAMDTDWLTRNACKEIADLTADRNSVLIFTTSVAHCEHVAAEITKLTGQECGIVTGDTPSLQRDEILRRFKGERIKSDLFGSELEPLKYLANVNVLTTGFDATNIDCVVLLRPTASAGLLIQMVGRGTRLHPGKKDCLILDFGGNILRHGPIDEIKIKEASSGGGDAPAKECPKCSSLIHAAYRNCPDCGHEFPPPETSNIETKADTSSILSDEIEDNTYKVKTIYYSVHTKKGADDDTPKTMRIEYEIGMYNFVSEWVCPEHAGWARGKFEDWWKQRSHTTPPQTAAEAFELAYAGALARSEEITVRSISGQKFDRIIAHTIGEIPEFREPGWEDDGGLEPAGVFDNNDDWIDDIPF